MSWPRLTAVVLVVGLSIAPLAGVYCNDLSPQAARCCTGDPANCGEPGRAAVGDDCCQKVPAGKDSAEHGQSGAAKGAGTPVLATAPALPAPGPVAGIAEGPAAPTPEPTSAAPTILRL